MVTIGRCICYCRTYFMEAAFTGGSPGLTPYKISFHQAPPIPSHLARAAKQQAVFLRQMICPRPCRSVADNLHLMSCTEPAISGPASRSRRMCFPNPLHPRSVQGLLGIHVVVDGVHSTSHAPGLHKRPHSPKRGPPLRPSSKSRMMVW